MIDIKSITEKKPPEGNPPKVGIKNQWKKVPGGQIFAEFLFWFLSGYPPGAIFSRISYPQVSMVALRERNFRVFFILRLNRCPPVAFLSWFFIPTFRWLPFVASSMFLFFGVLEFSLYIYIYFDIDSKLQKKYILYFCRSSKKKELQKIEGPHSTVEEIGFPLISYVKEVGGIR